MPTTLETEVGTFGPEDVDAVGDLAPKVVKSQQAHELINRVRAQYPLELVVLESRDEDRPRSRALDNAEVLEKAIASFGDNLKTGGVVKILSQRVRGRTQAIDDKAVVVLWETPSGRTARGAFSYSGLTASIDRFDRLIAAGELVEVDETDAKDLGRTVERQQEHIKRLNARLGSGDAGDPAAATGLTTDDVRQMIADALADAGADYDAAAEAAAKAAEEAQKSIDERDDEIARLNAQLEEANAAGRDPGSPAPQPLQPETTRPDLEDAADGTGTGSVTEAEVDAANGLPPVADGDPFTPAGDFAAANGASTGDIESATDAAEQPSGDGDQAAPVEVEAPQGKQAVLLGAMDTYSAEQLGALLSAEREAHRPRPKVIEAAEAAQAKLAESAEG